LRHLLGVVLGVLQVGQAVVHIRLHAHEQGVSLAPGCVLLLLLLVVTGGRQADGQQHATQGNDRSHELAHHRIPHAQRQGSVPRPRNRPLTRTCKTEAKPPRAAGAPPGPPSPAPGRRPAPPSPAACRPAATSAGSTATCAPRRRPPPSTSPRR